MSTYKVEQGIFGKGLCKKVDATSNSARFWRREISIWWCRGFVGQDRRVGKMKQILDKAICTTLNNERLERIFRKRKERVLTKSYRNVYEIIQENAVGVYNKYIL